MADRTGGNLTMVPGRDGTAMMLSSPELLRWRAIPLGTIRWPGEPERKYLPAGLTLTAEDRARIKARLADLRGVAVTEPGAGRNEKLAAIARLLLAYPVSNASQESGVARGGAYLDALDDIPAWAIADAVRRWNRGEAGDGLNYTFAPAPAILRKVALQALQPFLDAIRDLEGLDDIKTLDEAMAAKADAERNPLVPRLKSV
jgi:hypothetical protein